MIIHRRSPVVLLLLPLLAVSTVRATVDYRGDDDAIMMMACMDTRVWFNDSSCSGGDPDVEGGQTMPVYPTDDLCVPVDCDPPFTACSMNHQYCDMLTNAFTVTLYAGTGDCSPHDALYVETYSMVSGKCYGDANEPSIMVTCSIGDCPTTTTTAGSSAARDHRALVAASLAGMMMVKQPPRP